MNERQKKLKDWCATLRTLLADCPADAEVVYDENCGVVVVDRWIFEESGYDSFDDDTPGVFAIVNENTVRVHPTGEWPEEIAAMEQKQNEDQDRDDVRFEDDGDG